jgi:hypothetical protein
MTEVGTPPTRSMGHLALYYLPGHEQAARAEFYIVTQPDFVLTVMAARADQLRARKAPEYRPRPEGDAPRVRRVVGAAGS